MSGPIVRKYGFANFDKIFGERELKHGTTSEATPPVAPSSPADPLKPDQGLETVKDESIGTKTTLGEAQE